MSPSYRYEELPHHRASPVGILRPWCHWLMGRGRAPVLELAIYIYIGSMTSVRIVVAFLVAERILVS